MKQHEIVDVFSTNIPELSRKMNFRQIDLAEKIGVSRSLVGAWEEGRSFPTYESLIKLSTLFNLTVHDLVTNDNIAS